MEFHGMALLAASFLLFQTGQMTAQEKAVLGQGNVSCDSWLEVRRSGDVQVAARTAWVLGYVTAFNQYGSKPEGDVTEGKNTEEMMVWIDNYCRTHPEENVYRAAAALVDDYRQRIGR